MNNLRHRYFLYARKSSESEDRQMASIPDQIKEIQRVAKELELTIVDIISESRSAKAPGREGFNEMLSRIRKGEADGIICWKLNRLARNPVDGGEISWMLQQGVIQHIQCYGRDYKPSDNVLMMQVEFGMANQYVKDLSVDVKRGLRQKAEKGWFPAGRLPMGYQHNRDRNNIGETHEIIPDENFSVLKELWRLMLTGKYSVSDIKRLGDKKGLVGSTGRPVSLNTYHLMFNSTFYCGFFQWRDQDGIKKEYKGEHTPMVTIHEFEQIQRTLGHRSVDTRVREHDFLFKGILTCGECGCSVSAERKRHVWCIRCKRKFSCLRREECPRCRTPISKMHNPKVFEQVYYRCTHRKKSCSQRYITEEKLKRVYLEAVKSITVHSSFRELTVDEVMQWYSELKFEDQKQASILKSRIAKLKNRLKRLAVMRADGELGAGEYQESRDASLNEIQSKEQRLSLIQEDGLWVSEIEDFLDIGKQASKILETDDITAVKGLLSKIGSNHILKDGKVEFIRAKPLLAIQNFVNRPHG